MIYDTIQIICVAILFLIIIFENVKGKRLEKERDQALEEIADLNNKLKFIKRVTFKKLEEADVIQLVKDTEESLKYIKTGYKVRQKDKLLFIDLIRFVVSGCDWNYIQSRYDKALIKQLSKNTYSENCKLIQRELDSIKCNSIYNTKLLINVIIVLLNK